MSMQLFMEPFNVIFHDYSVENAFNASGDGFSGPYADVFSYYSKIIFGPIQINWSNGGDKGFCDQSLCSSHFLRSIQSGHYDLGFPPLQLTIFNGLPENITMSPIVEDLAGIFLNLYTDKSFRSAHPGILTSFKAIAANLYFLICILFAVGLTVYHVRSNAKYFYAEKNSSSRFCRHWFLKWLIKMINGKLGLHIIVSIHLSIYSILLLLSASLTTDYSITVMKPPVNTMEDLIQINAKAGISEDLYCLDKFDKNIIDKALNKLKAESGNVAFPKYIFESLNEERFFIFDGDEFTLSEARVFCNAMVQMKKTNNFNIIFGNKRYFDTLQALAYNSYIDEWKRNFIIKRSYSCLEMGICKDALDATIEKIYSRGYLKIVPSAQCIKFEQRESKSDTFQPIKFINMYDLLHLLECLVGFCSLIFLIEIFSRSESLFKGFSICS